MLIENVRFHAEEEKERSEFAKELASLADIYCNDAFGSRPPSCPRFHSRRSCISPPQLRIPHQKESALWAALLKIPSVPLLQFSVGAKVSDKIGVITNLLDKVDTLIIGGAMALYLQKAAGESIGTSLCEDDKRACQATLLNLPRKRALTFSCP